MDEKEFKKALADGLAEAKGQIVTEVAGEVSKTLDERLKSVEAKVEKIEAAPAAKVFGAPAIVGSRKYRGYDIGKQCSRIREMASKNPHLFPVFSNEEKVDEFAKFMLALVKVIKNRDLSAQADLQEIYAKANYAEGSDATGGYLVPQEFQADLIMLARNSTFALQNCTVLPMSTDNLVVPKEASLVSVAWNTEAGQLADSEGTVGQINLVAKRLDGLATVSNELLMDSAIDIAGMLAEQFSYATLLELDNQVLNGTGNPCSGVLSAAAGKSVQMGSGSTTIASVTATYLSNMIAQIEEGYLNGARFVMNKSAKHYIRSLKDTNGQFIFAQPGAGVPGTVWEYPYVDSEKAPSAPSANAAFLAFGNFKQFFIGRRVGAMSIDVDPYGKFDYFQTRFRMVTRWALSIGQANAFCRLLTAAS